MTTNFLKAKPAGLAAGFVLGGGMLYVFCCRTKELQPLYPAEHE